MSFFRGQRAIAIGLAGAVTLSVGAWGAGRSIRSPAQVAAETAPPAPSAITVPVQKEVLSSEVIVRGTVRYGAPQPVVLATSALKQGTSNSSDIVTTRPRHGARVGEGSVVMSVSGRPVFVLRGAQPSHRDLSPGDRGPDVKQLEVALSRMGFNPGPVDGRYDGATAAGVASWYEKAGYKPFGPTDSQLDQLRTARAAANTAQDAYLQSKIVIQNAAHPVPPGDIEQARIDLQTAHDAVDTAEHDVAAQSNSVTLALLSEKRDNALADADTAAKRAALNKARDALAEAQRNLAQAPPDTSASEQATLQATVRQAGDDVTVAQADLNASLASGRATRSAGQDAVAKARADKTRAARALPTARRQVTLASLRLRALQKPGDTAVQKLAAQNAQKEANQTAADASRLARKLGISVPANEILFFSTLPLRIDSVRARRGDTVTGRVMTVSNSRLAVDSSLGISDAKLVKVGDSVKIEEPDLGIKATGTVTQVADRPGTHKVDPDRVYLEITPGTAPAQLLGTSVKLTIAVKSTQQAVLTVPVTALSVGADGSSRVQVQRPGGQTQYVSVTPGLATKGLVEVRPGGTKLAPGDLVIVGQRGDSASAASAGSAAGGGSAPGGTSGGTSSGSTGTSGGRTPPTGSTGKSGGSGGATGGSSVGTTP